MEKDIKSILLTVSCALILLFTLAATGWSDVDKEPCTIMKPDRETLLQWIRAFEEAPEVYLDDRVAFTISTR